MPSLFHMIYSQDDGADTYVGSDISKLQECVQSALVFHNYDDSSNYFHQSVPHGITSTWTWRVLQHFINKSTPGDYAVIPLAANAGDTVYSRISITNINPPKS